MLFNSYEFILLYLPFTLLVYYKLAKYLGNSYAKNFLIFMSLAFYSYWDINNLPILLTSIIANYIFGHFLTQKKDKITLTCGILFNLAFLGYFKYTDFVIQNINTLLNTDIPLQNIVLPLGISFFTFTQTAYLVDVYRGETKEYSKSDYLLFVTIFPHLIAGPILYHKDMIPQFSVSENYKVNYKNITYGIIWFVIGLFKKVIIADKLAITANQAFSNVDKLTMYDAWIGSLAYTLQLYFDFSACSEMAIGLGLMFNYNLPLNFNLPYRSCSIIEFWRRWHMTLSAFLKNYLYIPLGGNRTGHHLRNIMITMFLGGLWHGAGWTFIVWGCLHGIFICINHVWRKTQIVLPKALCWFLTFNVVNIAWVFFRTEDIFSAISIVCTMFDINKFYLPHSNSMAKYIADFGLEKTVLNLKDSYGLILPFFMLSIIRLNKSIVEKYNVVMTATICAIVFVYSILNFSKISEFLYFQF